MTAAVPPKVNRTLAGLRESLFDALDKLRSGGMTSNEAKAHAEIAKQILDAARLQLTFEEAFSAKKLPEKLTEVRLVEHKP